MMTELSSAHKAALGLLNTVAYADGFSQMTFDWLEDDLRKKAPFSELSIMDYRGARSEITDKWRQGPRDEVWRKWVRDLPRSWSMQVFELAVEAVLLDGELADIERKGLIVMARDLGISPEDCDAAARRVAGRP
jgi:hypothetical protein